jgi:two-component system, OmpR family, response regulator
MRRVLLVEDDPILRTNYEALLVAHRLSVCSCQSSEEARRAFGAEDFNVVILDVTLGAEYEAGFDLCREFRALRPEVPIIFLTEHDQDADRISGLRMGADDYLSKTISGSYLAARVNALIRRVEALIEGVRELPQRTHHEGRSSLRVDDRLSVAYWNGTRLNLSLTQFWILRDLFLHAGEVRSTTDLMRAANITVQPNTIVVHIKSIREQIQALSPEFACIKSERARGYRWVEE